MLCLYKSITFSGGYDVTSEGVSRSRGISVAHDVTTFLLNSYGFLYSGASQIGLDPVRWSIFLLQELDVKNRHTKPEMILRRHLWATGLRYRTHVSSLPGTPDIVFLREKFVVFVNGCFWHSHSCRETPLFVKNAEYWHTVLKTTRMRDRENIESLCALGYSSTTFWECEINKDARSCVDQVMGRLHFARRRQLGSRKARSDR